jgi:hypothetical protein
MKKSRSLFGRLNNEVRRNSADKATAFHRSSLREKALPKNACRPKLCALSVLSGVNLGNIFKLISVNLCNLWLKDVQSKMINYAKRTQFFKKSNTRKPNRSNELQRKMQIGHLVKTNPNKANL